MIMLVGTKQCFLYERIAAVIRLQKLFMTNELKSDEIYIATVKTRLFCH